MKDNDPLNSILREWESPEPSSGLDARVRAAYLAMLRPSPWKRMWFSRVSIPIPVLAGLLLLVTAMWWIQSRSRTLGVQPVITSPAENEYVTRIEIAGYQPLPNGATRILRGGKP